MLDPKPITIQINGYHAHVYYNTETKPTAERLAEAIGKKFAVKFGGFRDRSGWPASNCEPSDNFRHRRV
jgi:aromatic ring-cleaving dioxygenase